MADTVYKKIELVGTSTESFSAAAANAVDKAKKTVIRLDIVILRMDAFTSVVWIEKPLASLRVSRT